MKKTFAFLTILFVTTVFSAQDDECPCTSQLLRVRANPGAVQSVLTNTTNLTPLVERFQQAMRRPDFSRGFLGEYRPPAIAFPINKVVCDEAVSACRPGSGRPCNEAFRNVTCELNLCVSESVPEEVKRQVCYRVHCPIIMGPSRIDACPRDTQLPMSAIQFPGGLNLQKLSFDPQRPLEVSSEGNRLRLCSNITEFEMNLSARVTFMPTRGVQAAPVGIDNAPLKLDGPRRVCVSFTVDVQATPSISNIQVENGNQQLISNAMITQAEQTATFVGLEGYTEAERQALRQGGFLAGLGRQFRTQVEDSIRGTIAQKFETMATDFVASLRGGGQFSLGGPAPAQAQSGRNQSGLTGEMGMANFSFQKYADLLDCALLKQERKPIPAEHACIGQTYPFGDEPLAARGVPSVERSLEHLRRAFERFPGVTSERTRNQLAGFQSRLQPNQYAQLVPISERIGLNQVQRDLNDQVIVRGNGTTDLGFSVFSVGSCDRTNPSSHANVSIPNCPIEGFIDLEEVNRLMAQMHTDGRLCHSGNGPFRPQLNAQGRQVYDRSDAPVGTGCFVRMEDKDDGMRCFLNEPPKMVFDGTRYRLQLKTQGCYRGPVFLGQGKIGGDIDFNIGFTPSICENGSFCLQNIDPQWQVVDNDRVRYGLREESRLNGIVKKTIDKQLKSMTKLISFPLMSGPVASSPIVPDGRTAQGPGYFGACFVPRSEARLPAAQPQQRRRSQRR